MDSSASRIPSSDDSEAGTWPSQAQTSTGSTEGGDAAPVQSKKLFENQFQIEDLMVFDDITMQSMLKSGGFGLTLQDLAWSLHDAPEPLVERIVRNIPAGQCSYFIEELRRSLSGDEVEAARRRVLDGLFWELTYWKTPELYDELTEGEPLHPGIFQRLEPDLRDKIVLDVGAGT